MAVFRHRNYRHFRGEENEGRRIIQQGRSLPVNLMTVHLGQLFVPVIEKIGKVRIGIRGSLIYRLDK